jgi:hypothetical protein
MARCCSKTRENRSGSIGGDAHQLPALARPVFHALEEAAVQVVLVPAGHRHDLPGVVRLQPGEQDGLVGHVDGVAGRLAVRLLPVLEGVVEDDAVGAKAGDAGSDTGAEDAAALLGHEAVAALDVSAQVRAQRLAVRRQEVSTGAGVLVGQVVAIAGKDDLGHRVAIERPGRAPLAGHGAVVDDQIVDREGFVDLDRQATTLDLADRLDRSDNVGE